MQRILSLSSSCSFTLTDTQRRLLEGSAVLLTGALHLAWPIIPLPRAVFTISACVLWGGYVFARARKDPEALSRWGFRTDNIRQSSRPVAALVLLAAPTMLAIGAFLGHTLPLHMLVPLLLYPIWGLVQQFLVQGVLTANLDEVGLPRSLVVFLSALAFGLVHWTEPLLIPATFLLGLLFAPLYLKHRSLWGLGLAHGWLGTLYYYAVLGLDPLRDTFFSVGG